MECKGLRVLENWSHALDVDEKPFYSKRSARKFVHKKREIGRDDGRDKWGAILDVAYAIRPCPSSGITGR